MKLRDYARTICIEVGCWRRHCIWGSPGSGVGTEGDCLCFSDSSWGRGPQTVRAQLELMTKVAQAALAEVERYRIHANLPVVTVDYKSPEDMLRLAGLYTHDMALPTSTSGEVVLGNSVKALVGMLDKSKQVVTAARQFSHAAPGMGKVVSEHDLFDAIEAYEKDNT